MSVMLGILLNTIIVAGMIVWLSRGGGAAWINTLNATSLSTCISLFIIMETSGAVLGMFIWGMVNGKVDAFSETLGYLGIWFAFLGTHVLADRATNIGKRLTDGAYTEKKAEGKAKVEAAKTGSGLSSEQMSLLTRERPAVTVEARDQSQVTVEAEGAAVRERPTGDARVDDETGP